MILNMRVLRGSWWPNEIRGTYGVGAWKNIRSGRDDFAKHVNLVVDDGSRRSFWHDPSCGGRALNAVFLGLFSSLKTQMLQWLRS